MKNFRRFWPLAVTVFLAGAGLLAGSNHGVTIPFPRHGTEAVGLGNGMLHIESVTLEGQPAEHDYWWARHFHGDTTLMRWVFHVANSGRYDGHARVHVRVYSADGHLLASNDRAAEVNARDGHDQITVWTRIHTLDYPRADHVRIEATFSPA